MNKGLKFSKELEYIKSEKIKNACQKIFGDRNYIEMFEDLFDALAPHLEKMQLNSEAINKRIIEKYTKNSKNVI